MTELPKCPVSLDASDPEQWLLLKMFRSTGKHFVIWYPCDGNIYTVLEEGTYIRTKPVDR